MMQIAPYTEFEQPATKSKYRHESTLLLLSHLTILLCSALVHTKNCRILAAFKVLQTEPDYNKCAELQICKCIYLTSIIHHAVNGHQRGTLSTLNTVICKKIFVNFIFCLYSNAEDSSDYNLICYSFPNITLRLKNYIAIIFEFITTKPI